MFDFLFPRRLNRSQTLNVRIILFSDFYFEIRMHLNTSVQMHHFDKIFFIFSFVGKVLFSKYSAVKKSYWKSKLPKVFSSNVSSLTLSLIPLQRHANQTRLLSRLKNAKKKVLGPAKSFQKFSYNSKF